MRGELVCKHNIGDYKIITRKQHNLQNIKLYNIQKFKQSAVKEKRNCKKLLTKHFGLEWEKYAEHLQYYIDFFNRQGLTHTEQNECNSDCSYLDEFTELIV